ncbi:hypothetical protein OROGR_009624 [Orobanche gracilis]
MGDNRARQLLVQWRHKEVDDATWIDELELPANIQIYPLRTRLFGRREEVLRIVFTIGETAV